MPFEPGNNANPDGARKQRQFYDSLNLALKSDGLHKEGDPKRLRRIAEKLVKSAEAGEPWAIKEIAERIDGKATQMIGSDPDAPLKAVVTVKLVAEEIDGND